MVNVAETEGFEISPMEKNAAERRDRLDALRKMAQDRKTKGNSDDTTPLQLLNTRSYRTVTAGLSNVANEVRDVITKAETDIQDIIEDARNIQLGDDLDIAVLAPKKVDWDLRRGIQSDLEKLEKRTNRAVAQLVRERLQQEKGLDLAKTVELIHEKEDTAS